MSNLLIHDSINSCIRIEQKRISRHRSIPEDISFELDQDILSQIATLKNTHQTISFSADNLANLRYYFLVNSCQESGTGIIFKTYCYKQESKIAIIKSVIDLSGKAQQYIRSDALNESEIINIHYWLIEQILNQIPLRFNKKKKQVFWKLSSLAIIFLACLIIFLVPLILWAKVLLLLILVAIILTISPTLIKQYLSSWVLKQLLFGIFASSLPRKKIGLHLLELLHS